MEVQSDEFLDTLTNLMIEYNAQVYALGYLLKLAKNSDDLVSLVLEKSQEEESIVFTDSIVLTNSTAEKRQVTENIAKNIMDGIVEFAEIISRLMEIVVVYNKGKLEEKISKLLLNSIVVSSISIWESFLKDYLRILLRYNWQVLKSVKREGKKFTIGELVEILEKYDNLEEILIEEFLYEAFYGSIDDIAKRIERLNILPPLKEFPKWKELRRYYFIRNAIVHNNGKVSTKIADKIGIEEGTQIELSWSEVLDILTILNEFIDYIYDKTIEKVIANEEISKKTN